MTSKKLTIGFFTDTYRPQINGVATLLPILERVLQERGHRVYVFAPAYETRRAHLEGGRIFRFPAFPFWYHKESRVTIPYHREARRVFQKLDIVHSHTPFTMGMLGIRVARRYGIPHLHTYHTLFTEYLHYLPRYLRPSPEFVKRVSRAFCNRCDGVTVPTHPMKEELLSYGIRVPIWVLLFGMDMDAFSGPPKRDVRAELGVSPQEKLLLCAGRLSREKNVSFVLRAFRRVLSQRGDVRLVIVGDGPARAELEGEAQALELGDRAVFTGYRPWDVLVDYYKTSDLFVYGSKTETQGIVFTEAQAAGLPVVAVGAMGALEAVQDGVTGLLTPEDEEAFAQAVLRLLEDEALHARMSRAAREISERNSIQRSTERLLEIYVELIHTRTTSTKRGQRAGTEEADMERSSRIRGTTILAIRSEEERVAVIAADGQATFQNTILKRRTRKIRKIYDDQVLVGFAGATADALTLFERFEGKLQTYGGNLRRAAVELTKDWRTDRALRRLEALLAAVNKETILLISGSGDVLEPDDGMLGLGSGGPYALAAARALRAETNLSAGEVAHKALEIAAGIDVYTNREIVLEELTW